MYTETDMFQKTFATTLGQPYKISRYPCFSFTDGFLEDQKEWMTCTSSSTISRGGRVRLKAWTLRQYMLMMESRSVIRLELCKLFNQLLISIPIWKMELMVCLTEILKGVCTSHSHLTGYFWLPIQCSFYTRGAWLYKYWKIIDFSKS